MRLNQYLALAGLGSRRSCETLIREGRIRVNGQTVTSLATRIQPGDTVQLGTRTLSLPGRVVLAFHKPRGVITTCKDTHGRPTVLDPIPGTFGRLFPIGRLDKDSEGLLLLTNDGALAQRLTHPSHGVEKEYHVTLDRPFNPALTPKLLRGFLIPGGRASVHRIQWKGPRHAAIVLRQGLKRQIRLMFHKLGWEVSALRRIRIGPILLRGLPSGAWRQLSAKEITALETSAATPHRPAPRKPRPSSPASPSPSHSPKTHPTQHPSPSPAKTKNQTAPTKSPSPKTSRRPNRSKA